jgi:hypothetical protein
MTIITAVMIVICRTPIFLDFLPMMSSQPFATAVAGSCST